MNEIQLENIELLVRKLKDDIDEILNWAKRKNYDTPSINRIYSFLEDDKIDIQFLMSEQYSSKVGFRMCQRLINDKIAEYKNKHTILRMIYLSNIESDREPFFVL